MLNHEMLSIVIVPLLQSSVLDVSASLPFSLVWLPQQQRLGAWATEWRREAPLDAFTHHE